MEAMRGFTLPVKGRVEVGMGLKVIWRCDTWECLY